jgi:putative endonuclease
VKTYCTYILTNVSRKTLYTGVTSTIVKRSWQHKNGVFPGFTSRYRVNRLVYFEGFSRIDDAIAREKEIKGWIRAKKVALIKSVNPKWDDLSREWQNIFKPPQT